MSYHMLCLLGLSGLDDIKVLFESFSRSRGCGEWFAALLNPVLLSVPLYSFTRRLFSRLKQCLVTRIEFAIAYSTHAPTPIVSN
jgi:hypothetical protein